MDRNTLADRLDRVLQQLERSGTAISEDERLLEEFIDVYDELLAAAEEGSDGLTADDAYFFSRPLYPTYRDLLDNELREFLGTGSALILPDEEDERTTDVAALREQLEELR